jgi:outer membrane immunogenic protein
MKRFLLTSAVLALSASSAFAADLPFRKGPPVLPPPPPPPMWTGFYAGLNAGYNFGTNNNVNSAAFSDDATGFGGIVVSRPETLEEVSTLALIAPPSDNNLVTALRNVQFPGGTRFSPYFVGFPTGAGLVQSGSFKNTQDGFIGGGQIGYNYQWGSSFIIGIEADIQGTGIRGTSHGGGLAGGGTTSSLFVRSTQDEAVGSVLDGSVSTNRLADLGITNSANSVGATTVHAGVDWMGTVRGRLGWLWTPTTLIYATGGLTYGGVYANVRQWTNTSLDVSLVNISNGNTLLGPIGTNHTFVGGGSKSQTLVGWNVGGGIEWMFMPNWSLKAEGIYWNMGNMNVPTATFAAAPITGVGGNLFGGLSAFNGLSTVGATRVNYQGVIARAGVNYHFNWGAAAPVVARY